MTDYSTFCDPGAEESSTFRNTLLTSHDTLPIPHNTLLTPHHTLLTPHDRPLDVYNTASVYNNTLKESHNTLQGTHKNPGSIRLVTNNDVTKISPSSYNIPLPPHDTPPTSHNIKKTSNNSLLAPHNKHNVELGPENTLSAPNNYTLTTHRSQSALRNNPYNDVIFSIHPHRGVILQHAVSRSFLFSNDRIELSSII